MFNHQKFFPFVTSLKIAIIGAGNVATHLGPALQMAGHRVVQVFSRTASSASALADRLSCGFVTDAEAVTADAELYVFCVRDAVLSQLAQTVWRHLRSVGDADRRPGAGCDALFIHTAGSLPVDILPAERRGVLYPLQTFSRARQIDFRQVPLFIESPSDEDFLLAIASQLSLTTCRMDGRRRGLLHLAAVFVCNFTNHMYDLGDHVAREAGVPFEVLLPLIDETARKVHQLSPGNAQTGPAVRLDRNVMERHLALLPGRREKEIYELLSRSIYDRLRLDKD